MKRLLGIIFFLICFCFASDAFAIVFTVDADLNSISNIYYQNIVPFYYANPVNTNLFVNPGDFLTISANGTWSNAPTSYNLIFGPNGNHNENIVPTYPGAGYPVAALMARIGNGSYFFTGSDYSNYVTEQGILFLGFNDTDYGNNWGAITADVNIISVYAPVPEPSTILLFSVGGLAMAMLKRKK
jgi:hypothetical protein